MKTFLGLASFSAKESLCELDDFSSIAEALGHFVKFFNGLKHYKYSKTILFQILTVSAKCYSRPEASAWNGYQKYHWINGT